MAGKRRRMLACPNCGAMFPAGRISCPECGSDAETGWRNGEEISYQAVELPREDGAPPWRPGASRSLPHWLRRTAFWLALFWVIALLAGLGSLCGAWPR